MGNTLQKLKTRGTINIPIANDEDMGQVTKNVEALGIEADHVTDGYVTAYFDNIDQLNTLLGQVWMRAEAEYEG